MSKLLHDALMKLQRDEAQTYFADMAADNGARLLLVDLATSIYEGPGYTEANGAVASMIHAYDYLADRIGYEMTPHPKGQIRLP